MENIRKVLRCGSCNELMFPPFLMCENNDVICNNCRTKHEKCPLCRENFTHKPDRLLEALAKLSAFTCSTCNKSDLNLSELKEHKCYGNIACPIQKCDWRGKPEEIVDHWRHKNMPLRAFNEEQFSTMRLNTNYYVNMLEAHGSKFLFKSRRIEDKYFWALQYLGAESKTMEHTYDIEIINPQQLENKFTLSSYCQSIYLENDDLFKERVCIFTPKQLLEIYVFDDEVVVYSLKVKKVDKDNAEKQRNKVQKYLEKIKKGKKGKVEIQ